MGSPKLCYELSDSCTLVLEQGDITRWFCNGKSDAIVNAAHEQLLGGAGAIHRAAGRKLLEYCTKLGFCSTGEAISTPGFGLRVSKIVHTVGPVYRKPYTEAKRQQCGELLKNSYRNSLKVARSEGINYIAFPATSCGAHGYPLQDAAEIAIGIAKEEAAGFAEIHFVLFTKDCLEAWKSAAAKAALTSTKAQKKKGALLNPTRGF